MLRRPTSSRARYRRFREDIAARRTEGFGQATRGLTKGSVRTRQRTFFELFKAFWSLLRGYRAVVALSLLTVTVATGLKLIPPAAIGFVLDYILGDEQLPGVLTERFGLTADRPRLLVIVAAVLVLVAVSAICTGMWGRWLNTLTAKRMQSRIRRRVFDHAVRLPLQRVYQLKSGGVASILREDAGAAGDLVFSMLYNPWRAVVQLSGTLIILTFIDWRLLAGSLVLLPVVYITHRTWIARIRPLWRDIRSSRQYMDAHATEAFGGMRVVRSFGRQRAEAGRFIRNNHLMIRKEMLGWCWSRTVDIAWSVLIPVASALLLWYGGSRILTDRALVDAGLLSSADALTTGDLVMFLFYLAMLLEPLATLAMSATAFQNSLAGLDRILDLNHEPLEFEERAGALTVRPDDVSGRLALRSVEFTYPGSANPVLQDIDLDVNAGQTVALVGPSGAGKTTLCNLIARFYDSDSGTVELDGTDLRDISVESYRRLLGIVEQDIFLFDGTIAENIAYGGRGVSDDQIAEAARLAYADEFIDRLEHGYDSIIGERGVKLSGGQRQRLAIARALLADPRILILDEATSNLDTESERLIQMSLARLLEGRTSFVIAHRLSTIAGADLILVLEHGHIVERGTHDELMQSSGRYYEMVLMQTSMYGTTSPDELPMKRL